MKILFIQLPLIDHSHGYVNGNIDYAPAVISSYIKKNFHDVDCMTLPSVISNFCSDEVIVKYIKSESPDILCFTSYLWNVERNLRLSNMIRSCMDSVLILFGGPEISEGSTALSAHYPDVDIFIKGEGEWFFNLFLSGKEINYVNVNDNTLAVQYENDLISVSDIVEPLHSNRLNALMDGSVFIEMTRGCPYKCSYCFYSKNYNKIRELPFSVLTDVVKNRKDINEIYILSPTFDRSKNFISNLEILKKINKTINLHTEIRADRITPETAELMYQAGFRSLEVGLQSMNIKALGNVHRETDPEKELSGMENLAAAGIDLKIGIIPGLPGDDINNFTKTVDILCERGFENNIELYPLMILPGTAIREKSEKDKVKFQDKPPYYFLEGWNFKFDHIKKISSYIENKTGLSSKIFYLPDFTDNPDSIFIRGVIVGLDSGSLPHDIIHREIDTVVSDIHINILNSEMLLEAITDFIKTADCNRLYNIILYSDIVFNDNLIMAAVKKFEIDNFFRRLNVFNSFSEGSLFHFFQVTYKMEQYLKALKEYEFIIPVLLINNDSMNELKKNNFNDIPLLIENGIYSEVRDFLISNYNENPEYIAFKNENEMQKFYNDINLDIIKFPYSFGLKKL